MSSYNEITFKKLNYNGQKVKKWYHNGVNVFSAGSTVTYYVDSSTTYTEEVDSGASCLSPKTFMPSKSGWTFIGWREDTTASGSVLSSKVMGDNPISLYAIYYQTITLSYNGNGAGSGSVATQSGNRYYNASGNVVNPSFKLAANSFTRSGYRFTGWNLGAVGASVTLSASTTAYAQWNEISIGITSTYVNSYNRTVSSSATLAANKTYYVCAFASGGGASHGSINWSISNVSANVSGGSLSNILLRGVRYSYPADDRPNTAAISYRVDKVVTGSANRTYTATFTNGGAYLVAAQLSLVFVDATLASSLAVSDVYAYAVSSTSTSASLPANSLYYVISYGNAGVNQWGGYPGTNWAMNAVGMSASSGTLTNITSIGPIYCTAYDSDDDQQAGAAMSYKVGKVLTSSAASTVTSSVSAGGYYRNDTQMSTIILTIS